VVASDLRRFAQRRQVDGSVPGDQQARVNVNRALRGIIQGERHRVEAVVQYLPELIGSGGSSSADSGRGKKVRRGRGDRSGCRPCPNEP
jgi:hypothetical protein